MCSGGCLGVCGIRLQLKRRPVFLILVPCSGANGWVGLQAAPKGPFSRTCACVSRACACANYGAQARLLAAAVPAALSDVAGSCRRWLWRNAGNYTRRDTALGTGMMEKTATKCGYGRLSPAVASHLHTELARRATCCNNKKITKSWDTLALDMCTTRSHCLSCLLELRQHQLSGTNMCRDSTWHNISSRHADTAQMHRQSAILLSLCEKSPDKCLTNKTAAAPPQVSRATASLRSPNEPGGG